MGVTLSMSLPAIYNSRFFKADARTQFVSAGMRVAVSAQHNELCIADISVLPGASTTLRSSGYSREIWMPVAGSLLISGNGEAERELDPGSLLVTTAATKDVVIRNPYPDQAINLLRICHNVSAAAVPVSAATLDLISKNTLTAAGGPATYLRAGVYDSRVKDILPPVAKGKRLFFYIINGAFEVDGRLMEHRDGLTLWDIGEEIDFEALSEAAIILIIEY